MRDVHIAEKLGVSRGTVHRRLKAHYGDRTRGGAPRQIKGEYLQEIIKRRKAGKTWVTVEAEMGFSCRAMQRALTHFNLWEACRDIPLEDLAFAYELHSQGMPWKEITRHVSWERTALIKGINRRINSNDN